MIDTNVNIMSFEAFLTEEDTASLSHKGHAIKNGDAKADKVVGDGIKDGSDAKDPVEKSDDAAPGDAKGDTLKDPA